jgi:hypothetical protein
MAEPGGICVSRVVRDQVRDKLDFAFEDLGEQQVKNLGVGHATAIAAARQAISQQPQPEILQCPRPSLHPHRLLLTLGFRQRFRCLTSAYDFSDSHGTIAQYAINLVLLRCMRRSAW